jgi:hypothetical protein
MLLAHGLLLKIIEAPNIERADLQPYRILSIAPPYTARTGDMERHTHRGMHLVAVETSGALKRNGAISVADFPSSCMPSGRLPLPWGVRPLLVAALLTLAREGFETLDQSQTAYAQGQNLFGHCVILSGAHLPRRAYIS